MTKREFRWRLLKQALLQKKAKAVLILLAVTMGASVVAALLNLQTDLRSRMNRELRDYGPNVVIQSQNDGGYVSAKFLANLSSSAARQHIIAQTPQLIIPAVIQNRQVLIVIADLPSYRKLYPAQDWQFRAGVESSQGIFVGKRLAEKLRVNEQQNITLHIVDRDITLPIGGILESGEAEDDEAFLPLQVGQQLGLTSKGFHSVLFSVLGELSDVEREFQSIVNQNPELRYQVVRKIAATESIILDKISRLMGLVIFLIFVILFFCIHTTVSAILLSRQSEIALLRVLGARRKQIMGVLISELLFLGMLGGFSGFALGMFMAQVLGRVLFGVYIAPNPAVFLITISFSLILMIVSSFLPISRAVNRQAALVLKEA